MCSLRQIQNSFLILDLPDFVYEEERETLVTFRKSIQYDGLLINDEFSTVWRIMLWHFTELIFVVGNLNSGDGVDHKQIMKETR